MQKNIVNTIKKWRPGRVSSPKNCHVFDLVNILKFKMWKGGGGYPPFFVLGGFRSQKLSKKSIFLKNYLRRNAVNIMACALGHRRFCEAHQYPVNQTGQSYIKGSYSVMLLWKLASRTCCFNEWPCACMCMLHATICQLRVWRNGVACAKPLSSTRPILCNRRSEILPFPKNPEKDGKSHNGKSGNN